MHFIIIGRDYKYEKALERRMSVREAHLKNAAKMREEGRLVYAAALLNEEGKMAGSVMAVDFASEKELNDLWLNNEVYISGKVWEAVEINKAAAAPFVIIKK
jgi:hypothetical protein